MSTPPSLAPTWPHCGQGADPTTDPVGCQGIHVPGHTACLAHVSDADRARYLTGLTQGTDIDHRGTPFTESLLQSLLRCLRDPTTGKPHIGTASFEGATFTGDVFRGATFSRVASFDGATFTGNAWFGAAIFTGEAVFFGAAFCINAGFHEATFAGEVWFSGRHSQAPPGSAGRRSQAPPGSAQTPGSPCRPSGRRSPAMPS